MRYRYEILSNPYERMDYVQRTDVLIAKLDGTVGRPDFVIYLDKSARPVSWLVRELWERLAAHDGSGAPRPRPQSLFVNIDGQLIDRDTKKPRGTPESIADLRALFSIEAPPEGLAVMAAPSYLDGKRVLIVDEIRVSGTTLRKAREYLSAAFPDATFTTHAWMDERCDRADGGVAPPMNDVRWYERGNDRNRAVRESVDAQWGEILKAADPRIRRGWSWIAKVPRQQETGVLQLRSEIAQIAEDVSTGMLPYLPALDRPDDEERSLRFNGIGIVDLYRFARWAKQCYWADYNCAATITLETGPLSPPAARSFALMRHADDMRRRGIRNRRFVFELDERTPAAKEFARSRGFRDYSGQ